jgi:hypothetical protein
MAEDTVIDVTIKADTRPIKSNYETHGWVYRREDGTHSLCGGPSLCTKCREEYKELHGEDYTGHKVEQQARVQQPALRTETYAELLINSRDGQKVKVLCTESELHRIADILRASGYGRSGRG